MPEAVSNILYDFTKQLKDMLQSNLSRVLVYGSYARGDYRENSDVDVMVLVKLPEDEIKGIASTLAFKLHEGKPAILARNLLHGDRILGKQHIGICDSL